MDSESDKIADNQRNDKRRSSQQSNGALVIQNTVRAEPDNKYYEVEVILDGPRKRREHLFKYCYKVRWKGYGPEADTWQPIADLANVQDMIEEYKKDRAMKQREKGKTNSPENNHCVGTRGRSGSHLQLPSSSDSEDSDDDKQYDPVYGTVKDKFWKDLELGRHQNHAQLFSGDMYSKVKGCRRAAHAEAVTNIQRQQQILSKSHLVTCQPPSTTPPSSSKFSRGDYKSTPKFSQRLSSKSALSTSRSKSPIYTPASRVRKRSTDPFSARGYMSAKRSRRSRETKAGNQLSEVKQLSFSSRSETLDIGTASNLEIFPVQSDTIADSLQLQTNTESLSVSQSKLDIAGLSASNGTNNPIRENVGDEDTNVSATIDTNNQEIVASEMASTIPVESIHREEGTTCVDEVLHPVDSDRNQLDIAADVLEETTCVLADASCMAQSASGNVGASGNGIDTSAGPSSDAGGATSGGPLPEPSLINKTLSPKRSPLDARSEASGAVERSHDEDCLWNGACNRSDCKSNRRRNMKNDQYIEGMNSDTENGDPNSGGENSMLDNEYESQSIDNYNTDRAYDNHERIDEHRRVHSCENTKNVNNDPTGCKKLYDKNCSLKSVETPSDDSLCTDTSHISSVTCSSHQSSSFREGNTWIFPHAQNSRQQVPVHPPSIKSTCKSSSGNASSPKTCASSQQPHSSGQTCRSLFSSYHADSSDSSFDESPSTGTLLSRKAVTDSFCRTDPLGQLIHTDKSSTTCRITVVDASPIHGSPEGNVSQRTLEVRKVHSEMERPGVFSDSNSAFNFSRQDSGFSGGSGSATPGEQLGQFMLPLTTGSIISSPGKENFGNCNSKSNGLMGEDICNRQMLPIEETSKTHSDNSHVQSLSIQTKIFSEPLESRAGRKRGSEVSQPLEKIPSPNSCVSDLDRRVSTLTCDELEDFVEQGEERCNQKDLVFISNADLLQAVNLSKAEVVKHAIRQFRLTEHKLDFEQPDSTGLTLLMRAVQKGTVAIVEMLLEHGVNVNTQQTNGTTALMMAAEMNGVCLVALLLKYGANSGLYTVHTEKAETALMKAIKRHHHEVVNLMIRVGVNIAPPTCTSMSALELAVERRNPHIERIIRYHFQQLNQAFQSRVLATLEGTAELVESLFPMQCFPLRESHQFVVKFNSSVDPVVPGEGFLLFIAHTKITDTGVRCRFHGGCPIGSVTLNGIVQTQLTKEVNFVTSCHPIIPGCNTLIIHKLADYTSKAKLVVQAFRARLLHC